MSNLVIKTNNDPLNYEQKILLRLESLPDKKEINVFDAFGGEGKLWAAVKKRTDKKINVLSIDKNEYSKVNLKGDNLKFLLSIDLSKFDIIDLDAWGDPSKQLEIISMKNYTGIIHCTFIQTIFGKISKNVLLNYGYTINMLNKCQTIFNKNGLEKILFYINSLFGVVSFRIYSNKKKNYFYFTIK